MTSYMNKLEIVYEYLLTKGIQPILSPKTDESERLIELLNYIDKNINLTNFEDRIHYRNLWNHKKDTRIINKLSFGNTTITHHELKTDDFNINYPVPLIHNLIYNDMIFEPMLKTECAPIYDITFKNSGQGVLYHLDKLTNNEFKETAEAGININLIKEMNTIEYFPQGKPMKTQSTVPVDKNISYLDIRHPTKILKIQHPNNFNLNTSCYTVALQNEIESNRFFDNWDPIKKIVEKYSEEKTFTNLFKNTYALIPHLRKSFYEVYEKSPPKNIDELKLLVLPKDILSSYLFVGIFEMLKSFQKIRFKQKKDLRYSELVKCELSSSFYPLALSNTEFIVQLLHKKYKPNKTLFYSQDPKRKSEIFDNIIFTIDKALVDVLPEYLPIENIVSIKEYTFNKYN